MDDGASLAIFNEDYKTNSGIIDINGSGGASEDMKSLKFL
jgi:hypothetical protein